MPLSVAKLRDLFQVQLPQLLLIFVDGRKQCLSIELPKPEFRGVPAVGKPAKIKRKLCLSSDRNRGVCRIEETWELPCSSGLVAPSRIWGPQLQRRIWNPARISLRIRSLHSHTDDSAEKCMNLEIPSLSLSSETAVRSRRLSKHTKKFDNTGVRASAASASSRPKRLGCNWQGELSRARPTGSLSARKVCQVRALCPRLRLLRLAKPKSKPPARGTLMRRSRLLLRRPKPEA